MSDLPWWKKEYMKTSEKQRQREDLNKLHATSSISLLKPRILTKREVEALRKGVFPTNQHPPKVPPTQEQIKTSQRRALVRTMKLGKGRRRNRSRKYNK
jgi:hypothetical protein